MRDRDKKGRSLGRRRTVDVDQVGRTDGRGRPDRGLLIDRCGIGFSIQVRIPSNAWRAVVRRNFLINFFPRTRRLLLLSSHQECPRAAAAPRRPRLS